MVVSEEVVTVSWAPGYTCYGRVVRSLSVSLSRCNVTGLIETNVR